MFLLSWRFQSADERRDKFDGIIRVTEDNKVGSDDFAGCSGGIQPAEKLTADIKDDFGGGAKAGELEAGSCIRRRDQRNHLEIRGNSGHRGCALELLLRNPGCISDKGESTVIELIKQHCFAIGISK
jgi:hypothetical protein